MAEFQRSFDDHLLPLGDDFAVGVTDNGLLVGTRLDGPAKPWSFRHDLDRRPAIAGTVVVGLGGGELFALDGKSGALLWKRTAGGALRGIGDDGTTTVISLSEAAGTMSTVLAVSHRGQVIRQMEDIVSVGVPAIHDGYAFLPWQGRFVTVHDLANGTELGRVRMPRATSRAFSVGGAIFFGEDGVTRFDDRIGKAEKGEASTVTLPAGDLPDAPRWLDPGTEPLPLAATARDEVRLYARPIARGAVGIEGGRFFATYRRIALGLAEGSGTIVWVHVHDSDLLGGAAYPGGVALCDAEGKVDFLDGKSGAAAARASLGRGVQSCVVQIDGMRLVPKERARPFADQIAEALTLRADDLVPVQKVLLARLAGLDDPRAGEILRAVSTSDRVSPAIARAAAEALAAR
ncbi:MAG: PQQ-binding-like beta-propeller repeat protein [Byssovorax sp.]